MTIIREENADASAASLPQAAASPRAASSTRSASSASSTSGASSPLATSSASAASSASTSRAPAAASALASDSRDPLERCTLTRFGPSKALLSIQFPVNTIGAPKVQSKCIIVIDKSGSMSGSPIKAVASVLAYVAKQGADPTVITFDTRAETSTLSNVLPNLQAGGGTSFCAALNAISNACMPHKGTISVVFMTDGQDTDMSSLPAAKANFQRMVKSSPDRSVVVSTVGFGGEANLAFLRELSEIGTAPGYARFAETGDNSAALYEKLVDLFDVMGNLTGITLSAPGPIDGLKTAAGVTLQKVLVRDQSGSVETLENEVSVATCDLWLTREQLVGLAGEEPSQDASAAAVPNLTIMTEAGMNITLPVIETTPTSAARLRELETRMPTSLDEVKSIVAELGGVDIFSRRFTMVERGELLAQRQLVMERLTEYSRVLAEKCISEQVRDAKLRDLNHDFRFSKARRQRKMHERASLNAGRAEGISSGVNKLAFDPDQDLAGVDLENFVCDVSQLDLREVMTDSPDDVLGFGLRVARQEYVIDAPSTIAVDGISSTLLSRSSFEQAVLYAVEQHGLEQAQGNFAGNGGCALVGRAREPINAFLPLYICPAHAERVIAVIEPLLGYMFTLSPFGYDRNQRAGLFAVLGGILHRLPSPMNDRARLILNEFARLCATVATLRDTMHVIPLDYVQQFSTNYTMRTKAETANLLTVIGHAFATTMDSAPEDKARVFAELLPAFYEEAMHRKMMHAYAGDRDAALERVMQLVLAPASERNALAESSSAGPADDDEDAKFASYFRALTTARASVPTIAPVIGIEEEQFVPRGVATLEQANEALDWILHEFEPAFVTDVYRKLGMPSELERQVKRAAAVQSLRFVSSSSVRSATERVYNVMTQHDSIIADAAKHCNLVLSQRHQANAGNAGNAQIVANIVDTYDMDAFAGKMRVYCPARTNAIFDAVLAGLLRTRHAAALEALLRNEVDGRELYAISYVFSPSARVIQGMRLVLGSSLVDHIEAKFKGTRSVGHLYRESDLPNRHGHCNSNPWLLLSHTFTGYECMRSEEPLLN
ncbi:hypothetical protein CAOG_05669 [Capsaspora owczarzaki ATCC 30864]|uniref:VWFA domain-containing protein n=1 Tax=Capsaspora owczarzaki (strain ATCC 30864) TaxID=595528 RepID=A0A0D2UJD2_CAPO3|nr:hypothetical protein CAOG_05669 [Capsaspora owczarzaki ATCC 30864]KJE95191.1 hypothetical protein CAOG_005669 [Capsaspora owczarzaki ATCC 30864]|eukprot:XP_004346342.1 hypothetical protein CAOG_05669 [Capsaspora owczarzaki ATCC 30864]